MFEFKIEGLNELQRNLEQLSDRASQIHGKQEVPLNELLNPGFLAKCSRFLSTDEMFEASEFKVENTEDFARIPDDEWDHFIRRNTTFATWNDLLSAAGSEWAQKKLQL